MSKGQRSAAAVSTSWRRKSDSKVESLPEHRWQADGLLRTPLRGTRFRQRRHLKLIGLVCLIGVVTSVFLYGLLLFRPRTPFVLMMSEPYRRPFLPLSWSREDVAAIRALENETLEVDDSVDLTWSTRDQGLRALESQLQSAIRRTGHPESILIYIRMHSAVDGNGVPCLVPPGGSPYRSDTWLPVKDVLSRLGTGTIPGATRKFVVFDCSSVLVHWNQGILLNTFSDRLEELVNSLAIPNLAVLTAAEPTEFSATSRELQGGVFGHYLALGLAGDADKPKEFGNGDRLVSMKELYQFVRRHVNDWSLRHRGTSQQPLLISSNLDTPDFTIASVFNGQTRTRSSTTTNIRQAVSDDEIAALWLTFEEFQKFDPIRFDPLTWTEMEQKLTWLEFASESGSAYAELSRQTYNDLQRKLDVFQNRIKNDPRKNTARKTPRRADFAHLQNERLLPITTTPLSSLAMHEFFGTASPIAANDLRACLGEFQKSPTSDQLVRTVQSLADIDKSLQLELTCLLTLWKQYNVTRLWPESDFLARVVDLHLLAESAAIHSDERVLNWIRPSLEAAENVRRKIDDQVFLGGDVPSKDLLVAIRHYENSIKIAEKVSAAYSVRDHLAHELPYLAQWLLTPPIDEIGIEPARYKASLKADLRLLGELARELSALDDRLSSPSFDQQLLSIDLPFDALVFSVQSQRKDLLARLDAEYERLLEVNEISIADEFTMQAILSCPLLPAPNKQRSGSQQRIDLRKKSRLLESSHHPHRDTNLVGISKPVRHYIDELFSKDSENLAALIFSRQTADAVVSRQDSGKSSNEKMIPEVRSEQLRRFLDTVADVVYRDLERQRTLIVEPIYQNPLCERLVRASASFGPFLLERNDDHDKSRDPIFLRGMSEIQQILLLNAQRHLDDFWGMTTPDGSKYFHAAASNAIQLAKSIPQKTDATNREIIRLSAELDQRVKAAMRGLTTTSDHLILTDGLSPVRSKVSVQSNQNDSGQFPEGRAAVFIRKLPGFDPIFSRTLRIGETLPVKIPLPANSDSNDTLTQFDIALNDVDSLGEPSELQAVTLFRGNEFIGELSVNSMRGVVIDYRPFVSSESKIAVLGTRLKKQSIVIILDCSDSMGRELSLESERQKGSRLQIAKLALQGMLDKLAEDENHRVGVICFGHRVGWDLKQPGQLLRQPTYDGSIPDQIRPFDDVETILPLGRFNAGFAAAVNGRLTSIQNWGESPLYLAIIEALKQFDTDEKDSSRSIVVITDGMNYQFNPSPAARKSAQDVMAAWNQQKAPIHIVSLGIAADQAAAAQREFGEIARKTQGQYVSVNESQSLTDYLASLQKVSQFRVRDESGQYEDKDVSQSVVVSTTAERQQKFDVSLGSAFETLSLQGGEFVELTPSRDDQRLDVMPYSFGQPFFVPLISYEGNSGTDFRAGIHRPLRRGRMVHFEVSFQHLQRRFLPRPVESWVEIMPISSKARNAPFYVFYDSEYLPETSVPVLHWEVNDWPVDAKQAKVRVWCRADKSVPSVIVPLKSVMNPAQTPDVDLKGVPGVNYRILLRREGDLQVLVEERHSAASAGVGSLKVALKSDMVPIRVRHRFDPVNQIATHLFQFEGQPDRVWQEGEIQFTTQASAIAGAWKTSEPVLVDVPESEDVHKIRNNH